jgi:hypothetical protein
MLVRVLVLVSILLSVPVVNVMSLTSAVNEVVCSRMLFVVLVSGSNEERSSSDGLRVIISTK